MRVEEIGGQVKWRSQGTIRRGNGRASDQVGNRDRERGGGEGMGGLRMTVIVVEGE